MSLTAVLDVAAALVDPKKHKGDVLVSDSCLNLCEVTCSFFSLQSVVALAHDGDGDVPDKRP